MREMRGTMREMREIEEMLQKTPSLQLKVHNILAQRIKRDQN